MAQESLGTYIRKARMALKITQKDLAAKLKISNTYLSDIEHRVHNRRGLSRDMIRILSKELNLNENYLLFLANRWPKDLRKMVKSERDFILALVAFKDSLHFSRSKR